MQTGKSPHEPAKPALGPGCCARGPAVTVRISPRSGILPPTVLPPRLAEAHRVCPRAPDPQRSIPRSRSCSEPTRGDRLWDRGATQRTLSPRLADRVSSAGGMQGGLVCGPAYLPEEGGIPLHTVVGVRGLDLRIKRADHIVKHLDSDVISPYTGPLAPCVLICGLKNLKGSEPGGNTHVFHRLNMALAPCEKQKPGC